MLHGRLAWHQSFGLLRRHVGQAVSALLVSSRIGIPVYSQHLGRKMWIRYGLGI